MNLGIGGAMSTNGSTVETRVTVRMCFRADQNNDCYPASRKSLRLDHNHTGKPAGFCTGPFVAISNVKER